MVVTNTIPRRAERDNTSGIWGMPPRKFLTSETSEIEIFEEKKIKEFR